VSIFMLREMAQADPTGMMDEYIDVVEAEVTELRSVVERLRDALRALLDHFDDNRDDPPYGWEMVADNMADLARAALTGEGDEDDHS